MERRKKLPKFLLFLFVLILIWTFLQILAPAAIPKNSIEDLSGNIGVTDNKNLFDSFEMPWNYVYSVGDRMCHQLNDRSFFINGNEMPLCSRCIGIWLGLVIGLGFMLLYRINLDERFLWLIIIGFGPIGLDGVAQFFGFWDSSNAIRLITGLLAGGTCGITIGVILDEIKDFHIFNSIKSLPKHKT